MAKPYPQIVLFGDSLFERCVNIQDGFSMQAALQTRCVRYLDVVNRGFSGWNTANAVKYLPEIFPPPTATSAKIEVFVVLLGANDAVRILPTTKQHVPIDKYKENLVKIVTHPNITAHKPKIILVTPPPLDEIRVTELDIAAGHPSAQRFQNISIDYSEKAREVAREVPGVILLDLWKAIMDKAVDMTPDFDVGGPCLGSPECGKQGALTQLLPDGLHMSGLAYRVFYSELAHLIEDGWAEKSFVFPDWKDINPPE